MWKGYDNSFLHCFVSKVKVEWICVETTQAGLLLTISWILSFYPEKVLWVKYLETCFSMTLLNYWFANFVVRDEQNFSGFPHKRLADVASTMMAAGLVTWSLLLSNSGRNTPNTTGIVQSNLFVFPYCINGRGYKINYYSTHLNE